jgi:hypothetical protein
LAASPENSAHTLFAAFLPDVSGDLLFAITLAFALPVAVGFMVARFRRYACGPEPPSRAAEEPFLKPFRNFATYASSLVLLLLTLYFWPARLEADASHARQELLEITGEATQMLDRANTATPPRHAVLVAYLETVARRIHNVKLEPGSAPNIVPRRTEEKILLLAALCLALGSAVYALIEHGREKKRLIEFSSVQKGKCESPDLEKIREKLSGLEKKISFELLWVSRKSHKHRHK